MHGVLSTAALHLAYLNPGQKDRYLFLSVQHQDIALGPFREAMSTITSENCNQVLAFSWIMIIAQFAPYRCPDSLPACRGALYRAPANWIECLRGCGTIIQQTASHIKCGLFGEILAHGSHLYSLTDTTPLPTQSDDDRSLVFLSRDLLNLQRIKDSTTVLEMEAYVDSISLLRKLLAVSSLKASDSFSCRILCNIWPVKINERLIRMLYEGRPPALIITAHYCLLLQRCHSCWYMEHRALELLMTIQENLAIEWASYLEHPLRVIRQH